MPQAVTHILVPIFLLAIFRDLYIRRREKKRFPLHYVLIAGIGGVLPDIDIIISFILNIFGNDAWIHKTFTHSIFFPLSLFVLFLVLSPLNAKARICNLGRHKLRLGLIFLSLSFGTLIHLILDTIFGDKSYLLYPFTQADFGLNIISYLPYNWSLLMATLDGILLVLWIVYLEAKHKISDFI